MSDVCLSNWKMTRKIGATEESWRLYKRALPSSCFLGKSLNVISMC